MILDTVYVVQDYGETNERLLARSDAILSLPQNSRDWSLGGWLKVLPKFLRDAIYNLVTRNRYRVFGKYESCMHA